MAPPDAAPGWHPTASLLRATLVSAAYVVVALLVGRPDVLVLAAPLLVHAAAGLLRRPTTVPRMTSHLTSSSVREGEGTELRVELTDAEAVEHLVVAVRRRRWLAARPASGVTGATSSPGEPRVSLSLPVASLRWGRRFFGDGSVEATSAWAGYRWTPDLLPEHQLTTLPQPGRFATRVASPHPVGLVGMHQSRRRGDGNELESIRPFQPGDRLRRVRWPVSLRTGTLHVTSTVSEEDTSVLLLVDSGIEVGLSEGLRGAPSSLDVAVRAAGAVAEHHLIRGDRVGVRLLGSSAHGFVPSGSGRRHLHRVLETLARVVPGEDREHDPARTRFRVPAGSVVLVFTPMLSQASLVAVTTLASRGVDVVVVDCLPDGVRVGADDRAALAWRMRLLERRTLLERVRRVGIPVVAWRGPGTLDEVLRRLARRKGPAAGVQR